MAVAVATRSGSLGQSAAQHAHDLGIDGGGATSDEAEDDVPWIQGPSEEISQVIKGFPPVSPYIGVTPTLCYLLRDKKQLCCLQLAQVRQKIKYMHTYIIYVYILIM